MTLPRRREAPALWRLARGQFLLAAVCIALAGCGPASIASHLPHRPDVYLFQKVTPVQSSLQSLVLSPGALFPSSVQVVPMTNFDLLLPRLAPKSIQASAPSRQPLPIDTVLATYNIVASKSTQQSFMPAATAQIQIDRYGSADTAAAWLNLALAEGPEYGAAVRLSDPGIGPHSAHYSAVLTGQYLGDLIYVEERDVVMRIATVTPSQASGLTWAQHIGQLEYQYIQRAK